MMATEKIFNLTETVKILKPEQDGQPLPDGEAVKWLLDLLLANPEPEFSLMASYVFEMPVKAIRSLRKPQGSNASKMNRPRREEFELSGLANLIFIGNVRNRTDQPGAIDISSTLGKSCRRYDESEVIIHLPSEPESYIRLIDVKTILESELVIAEESLRLYAEQTGRTDVLRRLNGQWDNNRHIITENERKAKRKSAIQLAVEAYFSEPSPVHDTDGFKSFLKKQIELPKEVTLKDGQSYPFYFDKIMTNGVKIKQPKERNKNVKPQYDYTNTYISGLISREKKRRNTEK